jgi:hypothetical protein
MRATSTITIKQEESERHRHRHRYRYRYKEELSIKEARFKKSKPERPDFPRRRAMSQIGREHNSVNSKV